MLCPHDAVYEDLATKFFEHFSLIGSALNEQGLWNEEDGFYYDVRRTDGESMPLRARSVVGLLPLAAVTTIGAGLGASHQTGWTGLVANLIISRGRVA